MYFFTCGQPRKKQTDMLPERKRKAAKKRGYDVRTDSRLRHNNSTRSIPAHIRSYDNNGRSGAVTPSNTEP